MLRLSQAVQAILLVFSLALFYQCANPVSPAGGPRDTDPPTLNSSVPPLYTTNFDKDQIRLTFDEFIEIKNLKSQLIISPPMEKEPEFRLRGKTLIVDIQEPLKGNTTYSFYFGDAITDLTENNPLSDFQYVFSTGDFLDSLKLVGSIVNAFDTEPAKSINIMLYLDNNDTIPLDSMPYAIRPYFMTRSDKNGNFRFTNLPGESFLIFALEDVNNSLTYDQPNEKIAFLDSLVMPFYEPKTFIPSAETDTSAIQDTIYREPVVVQPPLELFLFEERDTVQRFLRASMIREQHFIFAFKLPTHQPEITPLNVAPDLDFYIREVNPLEDTITYWITIVPADTVFFEIKDAGVVLDTARVRLAIEPPARRGRVESNDEGSPSSEPMKISMTRGAPELNRPLHIVFDYPVIGFDTSGMILIESEDTLAVPFRFADTLMRRAEVNYTWNESTRYEIIIPDSAFTDLTGKANDTLRKQFITKSLAEYGHLILEITLGEPGTNHIIQLMQRDNVIREDHINQNGQVEFGFLNPGAYRVKVIYDSNGNGKWDTGDYSRKIQPERVRFFPGEINIRANWDLVENWEL